MFQNGQGCIFRDWRLYVHIHIESIHVGGRAWMEGYYFAHQQSHRIWHPQLFRIWDGLCPCKTCLLKSSRILTREIKDRPNSADHKLNLLCHSCPSQPGLIRLPLRIWEIELTTLLYIWANQADIIYHHIFIHNACLHQTSDILHYLKVRFTGGIMPHTHKIKQIHDSMGLFPVVPEITSTFRHDRYSHHAANAVLTHFNIGIPLQSVDSCLCLHIRLSLLCDAALLVLLLR